MSLLPLLFNKENEIKGIIGKEEIKWYLQMT